jgi:alpha-L-rhamnosidase
LTARAPIRLRCERLDDPLGLGARAPRLSWELDDERPGAGQTAWHVRAASSEGALARDEADLWDSGPVRSERTVDVAWGGAALRSRSRVVWKVRAFDRDGAPSPWSAPARFELGLLEPGDRVARWIASPLRGAPTTPAVVPLLRRSFVAPAAVASARLYATALGVYEARLNGRRVGACELAPGWTDYRRRVRVQTYDVTGLVREGENVLGALLGDGWWCGFVGMGERETYGERPAFLAQLEIELRDGRRLTVASDREWRWHPSAILASDLLMGETVDARQDPGAWDQPGYDARAWRPVEEEADRAIALDATAGPPVRATQEVRPVGPPTRRGNRFEGPRYVYDLGQNLVGRVRLRVRGARGTTLQLRHAEVLDARGELYTANLRGARQTDSYTLRGGDAAETFEPRFTFHGFRYVELAGPIEPDQIEDLVAVVLHSDVARTGEVETSDALVNRLVQNVDWGLRGNFVDVPTDCPQRNERLGWTGDAQVFVRAATYLRDVGPFFRKWLLDVSDAQGPDGSIPPVVPYVRLGRNGLRDGGPAWSDAAVICPWTIYRATADRGLLADRYDTMRAFVDHLHARFPALVRADPAVDAWGGFGDWLALDPSIAADPRLGGTPRDLIGTAFFRESARIVARAAAVLGRDDDAKAYADLSDRVREAFRRRFLRSDGGLASTTQTSLVLALRFDLLDPAERERAAADLARDVEGRGHLTTGFVGTPHLLHVLTDIGRLDLAYGLLLRREYPSWLYPVTMGATTVWERWDGFTDERGFQDPAMNSFNHYAYGAVVDWIFSTLAGLDLDADFRESSVGWRRALLAPRPPIGPGFVPPAPVTRASARLRTPHGLWETSWAIDGARLRFAARVPPGCRASVVLPDGARGEWDAGRHEATLELAG